MRRAILVSAALFALTACSGGEAPPPEPAPDTRLDIAQGELVGRVSDNGAHAWRGLPFAAAPEGDLRWRAPRPHEGWPGVFEALDYGPACPQITNALDRGRGLDAGILRGQEDCLTLDVYAPPNAEGLPVLFWIHGGGNVWGTSAGYDGSYLAVEQDVVVVATQYRLGPLGFFAHPAVRADAETADDEAANFALLDQIAALEWVRDNIGAFGGDPSRVTIFGESAGGRNVAALIASPRAEGLFTGGIIQSGGLDSTPWTVASGQEGGLANNAMGAAVDFAGADATIEAMREASLQSVYDAYLGADATAGLTDVPQIIEDGISLHEDGIRGAFSSGEFNRVPIITGTNLHEMRLFNFLDERFVQRMLGGLHFRVRNRTLFENISDYQSRQWRISAVDEAAALLAEGGHEDVWAYRFDWDEGGKLLFNNTAFLLGAAHGMEIPFVFNRFELFGPLDPALFNDRNAEGRAAVASAMGRYWASFAADGAPSAEGLAPWPRYGAGRLMRFDSPEAGGQSVMTGADSADALAADLAGDDNLTDEERCTVAYAVDAFGRRTTDRYTTRLNCSASMPG